MLQPPANLAAVDPATLIASLNVHLQGTDEYKCGAMYMPGMIQALAVNFILSGGLPPSGTVPNNLFNLRALILDNCDNQLRIDQDLMSLLSRGTLCNVEGFDTLGNRIDSSTIMGVQTTDSRFVVAANRVTAPWQIQLMSSSATSTALSNTRIYPYFARTVAPDNMQMAVIAEILESNDWSYVGVIFSQESYGINGFRTLQTILNNGTTTCIGAAEGVDVHATVAEIQPSVVTIDEQPYVNVVVIIAIEPVPILQAFIAENVASRYVVIISETAAGFMDEIEALSDNFVAVFAITFHDAFLNDFTEYVKTITYYNRMGIPDDWFEEFYQLIHECHDSNATNVMTQYQTECLDNRTITTEKVQQYIVGKRELMATYALREGLRHFSNVHGCADLTFADCLTKVNDASGDSRDKLFNRTLDVTADLDGTDWYPAEDFSFELGTDRYWNVGYDIYTFGNMDKVKVCLGLL